jgi:hypothetical protein
VLETYVPLHDTGGYDRARAPLGSHDYRLDQIKGTASVYPGSQIEIGFATPALHPRRHLDFTFLEYSLATRELVDPAYLVPSEKLGEVCTPAGSTPGRGERDLRRQALWRRPGPGVPVSGRGARARRGSGLVNVAAKTIDRRRFDPPGRDRRLFRAPFRCGLLGGGQGDEILMVAAPDNFGRHRLAFSKESGRWASLIIHGAAAASPTNLIQANIHRASFFPHPQLYVLIQHFDRRRAEWYPWSWFMRSTDFAKLARGIGPYLLFTTTLNPTHTNRWTPYRIPTPQAAAACKAALHGTGLRRAA